MKNYFKAPWLLAIMLCSLSLFASSCDDEDEDPVNTNEVTYTNLSISGANEVPANSSDATGTFNGVYDKDTKVLEYTITFAGITPTNMHFHKAASNASGGVVIGINPSNGTAYSATNPYVSPVTGATVPLSAEQETDLLAGNWYVNIHSAQFPAGEIRAQLVK